MNETEIAIKTSEKDDIEGINLLAEGCRAFEEHYVRELRVADPLEEHVRLEERAHPSSH